MANLTLPVQAVVYREAPDFKQEYKILLCVIRI